jgi:Tol biopolymer transport system component
MSFFDLLDKNRQMIWRIPKSKGGIVIRRTIHLMLCGLFYSAILAGCAKPTDAPMLVTERITERVSVASDGTQANGASILPALSADGRFVVFASYATNLVVGDTNGGIIDIFVHDRKTGQTQLVSIASDGTQGNNNADSGSTISADGRYMAFASKADNLVEDDTNGVQDCFVHDRITGETTRVSVASDGTQANSECAPFHMSGLFWGPSISADGRYVRFESWASNLVEGDTNGDSDIFVHDRVTGKTTLASISNDGTQENSEPGWLSVSADGRYVAFPSDATNLVEGVTDGYMNIFVGDRVTGKTTLESVSSNGTQANNSSSYPRISADGRYVTFESDATNLVEGDTNGYSDIFVRDLGTGK